MSNVVAVPRSITITLSEVFIKPATELAILSGPSSFGLSILTLSPVFTPGPTINESTFAYFLIA